MNRTILKDVPMIEGVTTIHFPDIESVYFRSLLDFLYSGQTCVPAADVEHLHDLLDLLQIKPGVRRTGDKSGKEPVEVLSRLFPENNQNKDHHPHTDINSNEGSDDTVHRHERSKSRESSPSQMSVKREHMNESSCDDDERDDGDDDVDETANRVHRRKLNSISSSGIQNRDEETDGKMDDDIIDDDEDDDSNEQKARDIGERRRSSSDPVNLSLGFRDRDDDEESNDGHIDVETIGTAPSKVSIVYCL